MTGLNGPFNRESKKYVVINELRTKLIAWGRVAEISLSNRTNLSQSELSEMHFIRVCTYGVCEHEKQTDLRFKVKQIQCAQIT